MRELMILVCSLGLMMLIALIIVAREPMRPLEDAPRALYVDEGHSVGAGTPNSWWVGGFDEATIPGGQVREATLLNDSVIRIE